MNRSEHTMHIQVPFETMEKVMARVNSDPAKYRFRMVYSTPSAYFSAIRTGRNAGLEYPSYRGDFFPATFAPNYVRSGFYSSRPASKASDRANWASGHVAKELEALLVLTTPAKLSLMHGGPMTPTAAQPSRAHANENHSKKSRVNPVGATGDQQVQQGRAGADSEGGHQQTTQQQQPHPHQQHQQQLRDLQVAIAAMEAAVGVHQHHDALPGTDLAAVAENYVQLMAAAAALVAPASAAAALTLGGLTAAVAREGSSCPELNISVCPATAPLRHNTTVTVVLFNPLPRARTGVVSIPVPVPGVAVFAARTTLTRAGGSDGTHSGRTSGAGVVPDDEVASEVHAAVFSDPARGYKWTLFVNATLAPLEVQVLELRPQSERLAVAATAAGATPSAGAGSTGSQSAGASANAKTRARQHFPFGAHASQGNPELTSRTGNIQLSAPAAPDGRSTGGAVATVDSVSGDLLSVNGQAVRSTLA
jgi:hypothetical protein